MSRRRPQDRFSMRSPLADMRPARVFAGFSGLSRPLQAAVWQLPLIVLLALEIGAVLMLFWGGGLAVSLATRRWQRWYVQLLLIGLLAALAALAVPVRSADFFITLMVAVLPLTWQLDDRGRDAGAPLSPAGLTPTIFLVGAVFLFQIQFFILLLVVVWLLGFLVWYCAALTGFRLDALRLRWGPVLLLSSGVAALIVCLFIAVPRVSTGFIPGFATQQKIALTDEVAPGGMRDLLADDTIAFLAVPQDEGGIPKPRYWRVFVLDRETAGRWQRGGARRAVRVSRFAAQTPAHSYALLLDDHDPATLPAPDWPAGFSGDYGYNLNGELISSRLANPRRVIVGGIGTAAPVIVPPEQPTLSDANPRLAAWARRARQNSASDLDFVNLLMRYFAGRYVYDTSLALPDDNALDSFFFEARSGYCAYFATAMATALRAAGIEAHVTLGYLGGEWNDYGGFWTVRNADAHAWVEARLDGGGWQRLDPTLLVMNGGGMDASGGELMASRPPFETGIDHQGNAIMARLRIAGQWVDALNTRITIAIMDYGQTGSGGSSRRDNAAFVFLVISLAMTGVVAAGGILALRGYRPWNRPPYRLERRLERLLTGDGVSEARAAGETLIHFAHRRAAGFEPEPAKLAMALADAVTEFRYSPHARVDVAGLRADLVRLRRQLRKRPVGG